MSIGLGIWLFMLALFIIYAVLSIREDSLRRQLLRSGKTTEGTVQSRSFGRFCFVVYSFQANELTPQQATQEVNPLHFWRLKENMPLQISYMPDNPRISRLSGKDYDNMDLLRAAFIGIVLLETTCAVFGALR